MPAIDDAARRFRTGKGGRFAILATAFLSVAVSPMSCRSREMTHPGFRADEIPPAVRTAGAEWDRRFDAQDAAGLAALYAEDVVSMPFNAPTIHGRPALEAEFSKFFSQYACRHETFVEELLATDDWAIERARYTLTYSPLSGGKEVKETGRHVMCRKKRDGEWQVAWELWNTDTPPVQ
jgi:uncharacterized protein (TIGR02246 family)